MDGLPVLRYRLPGPDASGTGQADHSRTQLTAGHPVIERIYVGAATHPCRVMGIVGCGADDAHHVVARLLAERSAQSGDSTLLADLSLALQDESDRLWWAPGDNRASEAITADPRGFDRLSARACARTAMRFRGIAGLKQLLNEELSHYTMIVVDAGSLAMAASAIVPAATVAQACDSVVLTATPGTEPMRRLQAELEALGPARSRIVGFVLDDFGLPTIGEELLVMAGRLRKPVLRLIAPLFALLGRWPLLWERA